MRKLLVAFTAASILGAGATAAASSGHITALRARFYYDHAHFGVRYRGFEHPPVDVRIYRTRGPYHRIADHRRTIGRTWRKVYATDTTGYNGLAVFNVYYEDLRACIGTARRFNYVAVFRLFNPTTDAAVDRYRYSFYVNCLSTERFRLPRGVQ